MAEKGLTLLVPDRDGFRLPDPNERPPLEIGGHGRGRNRKSGRHNGSQKSRCGRNARNRLPGIETANRNSGNFFTSLHLIL